MILIGKLNADEFKSNIENNAKGTAESKGEEDFPMIVNVDGYTFEVQANGTIEEVKGLTIPTNLEIIKDQTKELTATLSKDITGEIKWNIEDGNVVELSTTTGNSTTITAKGEAGSSTKITASIEINGETITDECIVTIVSKVTAINVSDFEIETGEEKTIEVSTTPTENVEKLTYTYNITSNPEYVTIDTDGKVKGISVGTATITITGVGESGTSVTATCTIIVKQPKLPIGEYVEYNVSYTDVYVADIDTATEGNQGFTANNGWRILDVGTRNSDGSYSGAKIISTGVPALLYYQYEYAYNGSKINSSNVPEWWGTTEQVKELYGETIANAGYIHKNDIYDSNRGYPSHFAATGLFKNFESILFEEKTSNLTYNKGGYLAINNGKNASGEIKGDIFKTNKALEIHNLTVAELNNSINKINGNNNRNESSTSSIYNEKIDLFRLSLLSCYNFPSNSWHAYWLATPNEDQYRKYLVYFTGTYEFDRAPSNDKIIFGVRPVITLNSDIYKEGNIWKIK